MTVLSEGALRRPLLLAKLNPPALPAGVVVREGLFGPVLSAESARVVLLRAPAGFGKTTALLQLRQALQQQGLPCAWLTVDEADNDSGRFLAFLAAALHRLPLAEAPASPDRGDPALALLDRVSASEQPFAVFLDDLETLHNPAVFALITQVIEQLPPGSRLVLGSRQVPPLGLGKLRARGRLVEVEPAQLRFSLDEASHYLQQQRGLKLTAAEVSALYERTEGWPAALWLASLALAQRSDTAAFIASFSGSDAAVAEYLAEDVFDKQPAAVQQFLLDTAVLDELNPALCDALRHTSDSAAVLARLGQAHLFLVPLEGGHSRYHSLFSGYLRAELARQVPERARALHRAASEWYRAEGRPVPAIRHALAAKDYPLALPLLQQEAPALLEEGRFSLLMDWLASLPSAVFEAQPMLRLLQAWVVAFNRGAIEALRVVQPLQSLALPPAETAQRQLLQPLLLGMMDRIDEAYEALKPFATATPPLDRFAQGVLAISRATVLMMQGRYGEARQFTDEARRSQGGSASIINQQWSEWSEASLDLIQGRLQQALARLRLAASAVDKAHSGAVLVGVVLAEALYENDQTEQAERLLRVYVPFTREQRMPDQLISAHVVLSRIAGDRGDHEQALQLLMELEQIGSLHELPRAVASARLERSRCLLMQGDLAAAREQLARADLPEVWALVARHTLLANDAETLATGQWRYQIRTGHAAEALPTLKAALETAEHAQRHRRALKLRLLYAEALHGSGQTNLALRTLAKVLRFAGSEGFVRTFVDEGPVIEALLRQIDHARHGEGDDAARVQATAHLERLLRATGGATPPPIAVPLHEPLTRKEQQVLELLGEGCSNEQMSEKLFISDTTVRTHLRSINVKLDARSRTQAVAIARRLGLIR